MLSFVFLLLSFSCSKKPIGQQTFNAQGIQITDFPGYVTTDSIPIVVKDLSQVMNADFGISEICLNVQHKRTSDLKISILSPNGTEIWLTNRNDGGGKNFEATCFSNDGFSGYIHKGKSPFSGQYIPDGRLSLLNDGQNPNGTWYLLVRDLKAGETGTVDYVRITFKDNPTMDFLSNCDEDHAQNCFCPNGEEDCELLPDLVMINAFTEDQIREYPQDDKNYPGQLRFAASILNIGDGPLEIFGKQEWFCGNSEAKDSLTNCPDGSRPRQIIYQKVYKKETGRAKLSYDLVQTGTNYYDDKPGHDHYHVDNWVEFRLVDAQNTNDIVAKGRKVSFCLFDTGICGYEDSICMVESTQYNKDNLPNYGFGNYGKCNSNFQGISVGGYDTYGLFYEGQYLEIPEGTPNGSYVLEIEVDPEHIYRESNEQNNILSFPVELQLQ